LVLIVVVVDGRRRFGLLLQELIPADTTTSASCHGVHWVPSRVLHSIYDEARGTVVVVGRVVDLVSRCGFLMMRTCRRRGTNMTSPSNTSSAITWDLLILDGQGRGHLNLMHLGQQLILCPTSSFSFSTLMMRLA
jgi:hypothetical protein